MKKNRNLVIQNLAERFRNDVIGCRLYLTPRLSLDDVAGRLGVSRYTLSHAVNDSLGISFCQFVNELRIAEAIRLMQAPDGERIMVRRLAEMVGFSDRKSFMRVCKKITGLSPSELKTRFTNDDL